MVRYCRLGDYFVSLQQVCLSADFFLHSEKVHSFDLHKLSAMTFLIQHLEYILRHHDCVVIPGIGALMCRCVPANFSREGDKLTIFPPSREVAFNSDLCRADGLLENSVARKCGISFEAARKMVAEEAASLKHQLYEFGTISLGKIGELVVNESKISFFPDDISQWDFRYYGLREVSLTPVNNALLQPGSAIEEAVAPANLPSADNLQANCYSADETAHCQRKSHIRPWVGIAAMLAVIISLALYFFRPAVTTTGTVEASMAPAHVETIKSKGVEANTIQKNITPSEDTVIPVVEKAETVVAIPHDDQVSANPSSASAGTSASTAAKVEKRFNTSDPYCIVVASFPNREQAMKYIAENSGLTLDILEKDDKYRVYSATGASYNEASIQKKSLGVSEAWICHR